MSEEKAQEAAKSEEVLQNDEQKEIVVEVEAEKDVCNENSVPKEVPKAKEPTNKIILTPKSMEQLGTPKKVLVETDVSSQKKRKSSDGCLKSPAAKKQKIAEASEAEKELTEEELKRELLLMTREITRRSARWKRAAKSHDRKLADLDRLKRKLAKSKENMEIDDKKTKELKEVLTQLQQEEAELEHTKRTRSKRLRDEISKTENDIRELKQQLNQGIFIPKNYKHVPKQSDKRQAINLPPQIKPCDTIMKRLEKLEFIYVFEDPVDVTKYLDYLTVVKTPMCMETVRENLYNGRYTSLSQFAKHVRLVFANARVYNPSTNPVHKWAIQYADLFEDMYRRATSASAVAMQKKSKEAVLTPAEVNSLQNKLADLPSTSMQYVVDFLRKELPEKYSENEITIDLDSLPGKVLLKLQELVMHEAKMKPKNRSQKRQRIKRQIETLQKETSFGPPPVLPPPYLGLPPPPSTKW